MRTYHASDREWERIVGYSRAVRAGSHIYVSGTVGEGDSPYEQAKAALEHIRLSLEACGGTIEHVVRTRAFVTDITQWPEIGRAHNEVFGHVKPAMTMVQVAALIEPGFVVEFEAEAIID